MNKNINLSTTQTERDNIPSTLDRQKHQAQLPEGVTALVFVICCAILVFWLVGMFSAAVWCNVATYTGITYCSAYTIATFWPLILIIVAAIVAIIGTAVYLMQVGVNAAWLDNLGLTVHRDDARALSHRAYDVAMKRAESEATRGIDHYSPSISHSNTSHSAQESDTDTDTAPDMIDLDLFGALDKLNG